MAIISKPKTFAAGTTAVAADVNVDFDTIYNDYNGNITDANIAANANIAITKISGSISDGRLSTITTAGKVDCSALVNSENTPASEVNGASQLVQMTAAGKLPAVDGSLLTAVAASSLNGAAFGAWATKSFNLSTLAATDGIVMASCDGETLTLNVYTDASNPPTTKRMAGEYRNSNSSGYHTNNVICPVKKGEYFKVDTNATGADLLYVYWIPIGA